MLAHRLPATSGILQRKCSCAGKSPSGDCDECRKKKLQRRGSGSGATGQPAVPAIVHDVLRAPGQPLDSNSRAFFEPRFGHDFSRVRVHTNESAAQSARAVNAMAYTVGQNIVFGAGQYQPGKEQADRLLAHELTHVLQQKDVVGNSTHAAAGLEVGAADDPSEFEAERAAAELVRTASPGPSSGDLVLRRRSMEGDPARGSTLPRRQAIALTECIDKMGDKSRDYCWQLVMSTPARQLQPGAPPSAPASATVKAGETGCEIRTGRVQVEIDQSQHPACMADCVAAHENVHVRDQGQKCQELFKLHSAAKIAGDKADLTKAPGDQQAAEDAFKKLEAAVAAYQTWFATGCKDREKSAYQAGLDKCSTPAGRCQNNKAEFNRIMNDWRGWAQNPPPTTKCP